MWTCSYCGGENDGGDFCIYCGHKRAEKVTHKQPKASARATQGKRKPSGDHRKAVLGVVIILCLALLVFGGVMLVRLLKDKDQPEKTGLTSLIGVKQTVESELAVEEDPVIEETPTPLTPEGREPQANPAADQSTPAATAAPAAPIAEAPVVTAPEATSAPLPEVPATQEPTAAQKGIAEMKGCDDRVVVPRDDSWLETYETKYVKASRGQCIILRWEPKEAYTLNGYNILNRVWEKEAVTEMARQNGFSLIKTSAGQVGGCPRTSLSQSIKGSPIIIGIA